MKRITLSFLLVFSALLMGCNSEEKSELRFFKVESEDFMSYVNDKPMPNSPDLNGDKSIINRDYPIEIALYNDGRWYYDLPNLDTGTGTWKFENGELKLFAKQRLFDMYIDVVAIQEKAAEVVIRFRDRFGPRILNTEKVNINP